MAFVIGIYYIVILPLFPRVGVPHKRRDLATDRMAAQIPVYSSLDEKRVVG